MTARTHLASSVSVAIAPFLFYPLPLPLLKLYIAAAAVGSLFPDIDCPHSYLGRRMRFVSDLLNVTLGHRGSTHTAAAFALYAALLFAGSFFIAGHFTPEEYAALAAGFLAGNILHALGDMSTKEGGIALLYPLSRRRLFLLPPALRYRTDGLVENLIVTPMFALLLAYEGVSLLGISSVAI